VTGRKTGQIIPRGQRNWLVRVFLGRNASGKRRYHNKSIRGTRKDAQRYLNGILRDTDLGIFVEPSAISVNEYLDRWLATAAERISGRTFHDYQGLLRRYIRPALGDHHLSDLAPLNLQEFYARLLGRGLSARTVRYTHVVLFSALKQAVKWRMLPQNPAALVDLPRQTRRQIQPLSPEEVQRFLAAAAMDRLYVLFAFALGTGMRPGEYLALPWDHVDLRVGRVRVQRALSRTREGGWHFTEPKTPRSRRTIPLPPSLTRALIQHRKCQAEERRLAASVQSDSDLVFASENGTPLNEANLRNRHFKPILKAAGLPSTIRLHDLRHSCATLLLLAGENPKVVSERLGHAGVSMTLDTDSHVLPTMQEKAAERLEGMLFSKENSDLESPLPTV